MFERRRVPALDGLRALALVAVVGYHVAPGTIRGGFLGVDMFFVLSGFLLASLLLDEHRRRGAIDIVRFAARRARRIAPALLVLLAALVVFVPLLASSDAYRLRGDVLSSLGGFTNWHLIADGSSYFARFGRPSFARHLWSIAVEIQFYAVCPFLVAWLARRRRSVALGALTLGIAGSAVASALLYRSADPSRAYYGTDTRCGALLVGVLLAVLLAGHERDVADGVGEKSEKGMPSLWLSGAALVSLLGLTSLVVVTGERSRALYPAGFLLTEMLTAALIVLALRPGWLSELLSVNELQWLGRRSYGVYLWFWPLMALVRPDNHSDWEPVPAAIFAIGGSLVFGALSYRLVERRFLGGRRERSEPKVRVRLVVPSAAVVLLAVLLMARVSTTSPLNVALQAGQRVLTTEVPATSAPTTTVAASTVAPDTSPPSSAPAPTAAPAETVPDTQSPPETSAPLEPVAAQPVANVTPANVPVTLIGDSVMVIASPALTDRLGSNAYIDAKQNRQFSQGVVIVQRMHDEGSLGRVLVIHLGNNGPVEPSDIDDLVAAASGVQHILLLTVRTDGDWQDETNDVLRDGAARYPNVITLVDWYSASDGHGEWFQRDGTHFKASSGPGNDAYADLVAGSIPAG